MPLRAASIKLEQLEGASADRSLDDYFELPAQKLSAFILWDRSHIAAINRHDLVPNLCTAYEQRERIGLCRHMPNDQPPSHFAVSVEQLLIQKAKALDA